MLTPVIIGEHQKKTAIAAEALKQGQWVYKSANTSSPFEEVKVSIADSDAIVKYDKGRLFPVMQYPADLEGAESTHETIAANEQCVILDGPAIEIEDDQLINRVPGADFANATPGDPMYLTVSGYPTFANDVGYVANSTVVAYFEKFENNIVTYTTA